MPDDTSLPRVFQRAPIATDAHFFSMKVPLLDQGRMDTEVARAAGMSARVKVYASGGENELHAHMGQDHMFVVMQGAARFYDKDGKTRDVKRHEGVMLPAGVYYWFHAVSDEPLVMLRVDNATKPGDDRLNTEGKPMPGNSAENKWVPPIVRDGAFFE